ncbi:MAG: glycosyltransferase [Paludibacteraceae bacterium]|nr:glycosyltransferase [Paludibacteraceae bacterium]
MFCAVIPTYNNATTLRDIIERTHQILPDIIVVNDGSTDNTRQILASITFPIHTVDYRKNRGKGYALQQGLRKAIELGYTHAITIDSDGQHFPEDIPLLTQVAEQQPECYVIGSRNIQTENMPRSNTFANRFSNFWFTLQTGLRLPDTQTGMRIYPLSRLHGLNILSSRYEAELELLVLAAWAGEKIVSVPIRVYYPEAEKRVSHFIPARDFTRISILNTFLCIGAIFYGLPRRWWRSVVYGTWFIIVWLCFLIITVSCLLFRVNKIVYRRVFHYTASLLMHTLPTLHPFRIIRHTDVIPLSKPALYICNHNSVFDILAAAAYHTNLCIIAQKWVFTNFFFGLVARCAGFISVSTGIDNILPQLQEEINRGSSLLIFPEGTRSVSGTLQRFHRGAFFIAEQFRLPIQPLLTIGTFKLMSKGNIYIGKSAVTLKVLPTIAIDDDRFGTDYIQRSRHIKQYYIKLITGK